MPPKSAVAHKRPILKPSGLTAFAQGSILVCFFAGILSLLFFGANEYVLFTAVGFFSMAIILIPVAVLKNYDPLSTWSMVCVSVLLGGALRGIYIGIGYPDSFTLDWLYILGQRAEYFIEPAVILLGFLVCCVSGYLTGPKRYRQIGSSRIATYNSRRVYVIAYVALIISAGCTILYVHLTGGFDILNISRKRTLIESVNLAASHRTWGALRSVAGLAMVAHLIVLADALSGSISSRPPKYLLAAVLFLVAAFLPFYASSRGIVFLYVLLSLSVMFYYSRKVQWVRIMVVLFAMIIVFQAMSVMRTASEMTFRDAVAENLFSVEILDKLILNRNDFELGKTAHIINAIPEQLDWQYGKTIAVWAVAFVPREFWNSKPLVSSGPIIGTVVYGNRISGVPPGMIAEFYWNFHLIGVVLGGVLFGRILRWLDWKFKPDARDTPARVVVYIYGIFPFGYLAIGTAFGYGVLNTAVNTVLALFVLRFAKVSSK